MSRFGRLADWIRSTAGAGLTQELVVVERKATGDLWLDDEKTCYERHLTVLGASPQEASGACYPRPSASKLLSRAEFATLVARPSIIWGMSVKISIYIIL